MIAARILRRPPQRRQRSTSTARTRLSGLAQGCRPHPQAPGAAAGTIAGRILEAGSGTTRSVTRWARGGGFPTPALELSSDGEHGIWFDGYVRTYLQRDLQDIATTSALPDFRRLTRAAALRLGRLVNRTELGRDAGLPQATVHLWLDLLETSCLLVRLPA
jgi:predicted AAA+ superfamily ATPase